MFKNLKNFIKIKITLVVEQSNVFKMIHDLKIFGSKIFF